MASPVPSQGPLVPSAGALPQPVLSAPTAVATFLVLSLRPGADAAAVAREVLGDLAGLVRAVGFPHPDGGLGCVAGIGSDAWDRLLGDPRPAGLHPFPELTGPRHHVPFDPR